MDMKLYKAGNIQMYINYISHKCYYYNIEM